MKRHHRRVRTLLCAALFLQGGALAQSGSAITSDAGMVDVAEVEKALDDVRPGAQKRMERVATALTNALKSAPEGKRAEWSLLMARIELKRGGYYGAGTALRWADEALRLAPDNPEVYAVRAEAAMFQNCLPCARQQIDEARRLGLAGGRLNLVRAGLLAREAATPRRNPPGKAYEDAGEEIDPYKKAVEIFEAAVHDETVPARKARLYEALFDLHYREQKFDAAVGAAEAALKQVEQMPSVWQKLSWALFYGKGELDNAAQYAAKAAFYANHAEAKEFLSLLLFRKWADAYLKDPQGAATAELWNVAAKSFDNLDHIFHVAASTPETVFISKTMLVSGKYRLHGQESSARGRGGVEYRDKDGDTTLANVLLAAYDLRADGAEKRKAGIEAQRELIDLLILQNANVNAWSSRGREPVLALAARNGDAAMVEKLIAAGANVHEVGAQGTSALLAAAQGERSDLALRLAELLMAKGANPVIGDKYGQNALHAAARNGHAELVRRLIARKLPVELADNDGWGPLEWAASGGHQEVVAALMAAGAKLRDVTNSCGSSDAADFAERGGHRDLARTLRGHKGI